LAAIVLALVCGYRRGGGWLVGGACGATAAETDALAVWGGRGCGGGALQQLGVCPRLRRVMTRRVQLPSDASASAWSHSAEFAGAV